MNPCPPKIRALLVEDERMARLDLAAHLARCPEVELVGEAASVTEAAALARQHRPDVVFLDIQLADGSGFDLLPALAEGVRVIFVTAHDDHAIRAFEVNALDYLLKPVNLARLRAALARVEPSGPLPPLGADDRFYIPVGNQSGFIEVRTIRRITAEGNYTEVVTTDSRRFSLKQSLHEWERRLPPEAFARVSRNEMVQLALIERVLPGASHSYEIKLQGEAEPRTISRRAYHTLRERLLPEQLG